MKKALDIRKSAKDLNEEHAESIINAAETNNLKCASKTVIIVYADCLNINK